MSVATDTEHARRLELEAPTGFTKIVVGLEADESSFEATRQAALLLQRNGLLTLMAAYQPLAAAPVWGAFSIAYLEPELRKMLKKQAVEQLWRSARDTVDSVSAGRRSAEALRAPFHLLPGAGHLSMLAAPAAIARTVDSFARR